MTPSSGCTRVEVGDHPLRRLGPARGDDALHIEAAHRIGGAGRPLRADRLGSGPEDAVREVFARHVQRAVALGIPRAQRVAQVAHELAPVDAETLGRHADVGVAVRSEPGHLAQHEVVAHRDVVPLQDDRAVERGGIGRTTHQDPRTERHRLVRDRRPAPVVGERSALGERIRGGAALEEELLFDVAVCAHVLDPRAERPAVRATRDRSHHLEIISHVSFPRARRLRQDGRELDSSAVRRSSPPREATYID